MPALDPLLEALNAYPRWLVALGLSFGAIVTVWVTAKLLKWTLYAAAAIVLVCSLAGIAVWWLG